MGRPTDLITTVRFFDFIRLINLAATFILNIESTIFGN